MQYARLTPNTQTVEAILDLSADHVASLSANKRAWLRPLVIDAQPVPSSSQVVVEGGYVVEATQVRRTWTLRNKTAEELERESLAAEKSKIAEIISDLDLQKAVTRATWDGYTANQLKAEQWKDRQVLLRFASFMSRRVKLDG